MIAHLTGTIIGHTKQSIIISTQSGVGYEVFVPVHHLSNYAIDKQVSLFTYLKVSENAQELFGFQIMREREFFLLLMTVSGIGPKSALNILSLGSLDEIMDAIARGDVSYLTAVQGMGKKTAERLVVELKNKISSTASATSGGGQVEDGVLADVLEGLSAMGYSKEEARAMIQGIDAIDKDATAIIREVLSSR